MHQLSSVNTPTTRPVASNCY